MTRQNYKKLCESRMNQIAEHLDREDLVLWDESGIKRLRHFVNGSSGVSDIGPGFSSWSDLYDFLNGMTEMIYLQRESAIAEP